MKKYKYELIIYIFLMILFSIIKAPFIDTIDAETFTEQFITYYIHYGELQQFNIIWITPIFIMIFFISKDKYLSLVNFNLRFHNRKDYFISIIKNLIIKIITYSFVYFFVQLPVLLLNINFSIEINLEMFKFISKYTIEVYTIIICILMITIYIRNYTYCFVGILSIFYLLLRINYSYIPFVSIFINNKLNIISVGIGIIGTIFLFKKYQEIDIIGEIKK